MNEFSRRRLGGAAVIALLLLPAAAATAADKWTVDMTLSGAGRFVSDDEGRFEERHGVSAEASGGVEDLYVEQTRKGSRRFRVRGHALFDEHDYRLAVDFKPFRKLLFDGGYTRFRTWDDATGGFFPQGGGVFLPLVGEDWALDRAEAWIHAGLRNAGIARADFRYTHRERDGRKGSLVWGDTSEHGGLGSPKLGTVVLGYRREQRHLRARTRRSDQEHETPR